MKYENLNEIEFSKFDFVDFGCSKGASLKFGKQRLGGSRGIGIDISQEKVEQARAAGFDGVRADLSASDFPSDLVNFVLMSHFLEHLPSFDIAARCIRNGIGLAREFVYIRQPWFDSDTYLATLGLKQFWSDWTAHTNKMSALDFYRASRDASKRWAGSVYGHELIRDSEHPSILPLASKRNQHDFNFAEHGERPYVKFEQPVYREIVCILTRPGLPVGPLERAWGDLTLLLEF